MYLLPDPKLVAFQVEREKREKKERIWMGAALASLSAVLPIFPGEVRKAIERSFDCADYFIEELEKRNKL